MRRLTTGMSSCQGRDGKESNFKVRA
jgi:hypothetical protein